MTLKDWSALDAYGVSLGTPGPSRLKRQLLFVMWNVKYTLRRIFSQNFDDIFSRESLPFHAHKRNPVRGQQNRRIRFKLQNIQSVVSQNTEDM